MSDLAFGLLISLGPVTALILIVLAAGLGPPAIALLANSRVARGVTLAAVVAWGLFVAATRLRKAGRDEALTGVRAANAAAVADRERIEREVSTMGDEEVDRELKEWTR